MDELFEAIVAAVAAPFLIIYKWLNFFKSLPPREANLARASHGAAIVVSSWYLLRYFEVAPNTADELAIFLSSRPEIAYPWLIVVAGGVWWFIIGSARSRGPRDALLALRAIGKVSVGILAFVALDSGLPDRWWGLVLKLTLPSFGLWCTVTGIVKLVLVTMGTGHQGVRPVEVESQKARGAAGDASPAEAAAALRGRGGRQIALDEREF